VGEVVGWLAEWLIVSWQRQMKYETLTNGNIQFPLYSVLHSSSSFYLERELSFIIAINFT